MGTPDALKNKTAFCNLILKDFCVLNTLNDVFMKVAKSVTRLLGVSESELWLM